jgi:isoamylase
VPNEADSAPCVPRSVVVADELFPWRDGARRGYAYADTIVYEMHVKGFTMRHPGVPPELRGTYAGLGHAAAIAHLLDLGVTAVELLPVHESVPEAFLVRDGLTNYWGYNTIGYFAPNQAYSAAVRAGQPGGQVDEFKAMVDALHAAGIEVILDVVFNHTAEGDHTGPTLCFRGLDNPAYYRLDPSDPRCYLDTTGCGNSLNAGDPLTLPGCSSSPGGSSPCARPTRCSAATVSWPEPRPPTCNGSPRPAPGWPTPTGRTRTPWPSRCTWTDRTPPTGPPTAPG